MGNALIKNKKLVEFVPATPADPGFPGQPAIPERVTYEWRDVRVEAGPHEMQRLERELPGGERLVSWRTPLDVLRERVGNPSLSAARGAQLLELTLEHPLQEELDRDFKILGIEANTVKRSSAALVAKIEGKLGVVELR